MPQARLENRPHDVTRAVRLPRDVDRQLDRLIEANGSNRNREIKKAISAYVDSHQLA